MLFLNRAFDKKRLKALLLWFRLNLSEGAALKAVEILQELGFRSATQGAISLGLDDLKTPASKGGRVFQAQVEVALANHEHHRGNRTPVELFQHLVDTWHRTSQDLTTEVIQLFHSTERVNPVYMMAFSGARGNISQVRQLVGMRGLMADPRGQIVGFPILSNFREGLTITEYFVSCYGARKGVVDTAIRTADAGYLTRRLADVSHHVVVRTTNCGTHRNIQLRDIKEGQKTILSLSNRLVGRVLAEHIFMSPKTIIYSNSEITPSMASKLASQHSEVSVRSPLSCSLPWGVCQLCYGWGLSEGRRVTLGEAVGIIAAQSIGEPGTQLTLRTFHTGGVFSGELLNEIRAPYAGNVLFSEPLQGLLLRTPHGQIAFLTKVSGKMKIVQASDMNSNISFSSILPLEEKTVTDYALLPVRRKNRKNGKNRKDVKQSKDSISHTFLTAGSSDVEDSDTSFAYPSGLLRTTKGKDLDQRFASSVKQIEGLHTPLGLAKQSTNKDPTIAKNAENKGDSGLYLNEIKEKNGLINQSYEFVIQPSTVIFVKQREYVYQNQLLAEFSSSTLQSANDQIEITQQVLSETAGQIWFKEIDYGNRKGPGSGSLGTHFSSQKLGGIWVLAGKPMPNTLSFTFCCPSDQPKKAFLVPKVYDSSDENDIWTKTININTFSSIKKECNFYPYSTSRHSYFSPRVMQTNPVSFPFEKQDAYHAVGANQIEGYPSKGFDIFDLHTPKGVSTRSREETHHLHSYASPLLHILKGICMVSTNQERMMKNARKGSPSEEQSYTFEAIRSAEDKEKYQIEKQRYIYETQQSIYESQLSIKEDSKISVINLQNDSQIINIKYNYIAGYSFISHEKLIGCEASIGFMERLYNRYRKPFYLSRRQSILLIASPTSPLISKG